MTTKEENAPVSDLHGEEAMTVQLSDVKRAADRLCGLVRRTPLKSVGSGPLAETLDGVNLLLKLENQQRSGSFKPRGALNTALAAKEADDKRDLITYSSGNHGQAVALAAQELGRRCIVVSPEDVRPLKKEAMEGRGATVLLHGRTSSERMSRAETLAREEDMLLIPPYDHPSIIAGAGTVGLEIDDAATEALDIVVVPVGGGGLISGVALSFAELRPDVKVIGVEPDDADDAARSLAQGERMSNPQPSVSACDGLRNSCVGELNWAFIRRHVDAIVSVSEAEVAEALRLLADSGISPVEPSGAASVAALVAGKAGPTGGMTAVAVVSGGNGVSPAVA